MASVLAGASFIFLIVLILYLVLSAQRRTTTAVNAYPGVAGGTPSAISTPTVASSVAGVAATAPSTATTQVARTPTTAPATSVAAPAGAASPTTAPSPSPGPTASAAADASGTPGAGTEAVLAAALAQYDAVPEADCLTNNPQRKLCAGLRSTPEQVQRGIAVFNIANPSGGSALGVMGRDRAGAWRRWFGFQDTAYQLLQLPGDVRACNTGRLVELRAGPDLSARLLAQLAHLSLARAEEFVLTEPEVAERRPSGQTVLRAGAGWYHLSAPRDAWAYSRFLADAGQNGCQIRDAIERAR
jgi:hypothetical protein